MAWAKSVGDESVRRNAIHGVACRWMRSDPNSAHRYLEQANDLPEDPHQSILNSASPRRSRQGHTAFGSGRVAGTTAPRG